MKKAGMTLGVLLLATGGSAQQATSQPVCWPLHFAGVTVGVNEDSHVRRLLGRGLFRRGAGDTGGRLFIDAGATATLETDNYTDRIVGDLTISVGVDSRLTASQRRAAVSQFFNPKEGFGNYHALHLGSTRDQVLMNLGLPEGPVESDDWKYSRGCTCELPEFFTISFKSGRIAKVVFSAPPG